MSIMWQGSPFVVLLLCSLLASGRRDYRTTYLSCQVTTSHLRVFHSVDISAANSDFVVNTLQAGAIRSFDLWLRDLFEEGVASGIGTFSNKKVHTGNVNDTCFSVQREFQDSEVGDDFDDVVCGGSFIDKLSVCDALVGASSLDWSVEFPRGRKIIFQYISGLNDGQDDELPLFSTLPYDCETSNQPTVAETLSILESHFIFVIFVVPQKLVGYYRDVFNTDLVIPQRNDPDEMFIQLAASLDLMYCGEIFPTFAPEATSPHVFTTPPPDCLTESALQLLHIQDTSWSAYNDFPTISAKFPSFWANAASKFYHAEYALASFSDKPVAPVGYPGYDYCFKEDMKFTTDTAKFEQCFADLSRTSGRDWKESQLDALLCSAISASLGWDFRPKNTDGRHILRVAIVATDAGPHMQGDIDLPPFNPLGNCAAQDYPSAQDVATVLDGVVTYPIFIVTNDIYNYWRRKVRAYPFSVVEPKVLPMSVDPSELFDAVESALVDACEANRRLLQKV